jgi:hypothetical protein
MWRKVVTNQPVVGQPPLLLTPVPPMQLELLLLPRPPRTRSLVFRLFFWAPTSRGSTTRAASFFQHVSATTWLRAS